ncbi:MAG: hypothetical protein AAF573_10725, partial [Bacteroidota bacterium]
MKYKFLIIFLNLFISNFSYTQNIDLIIYVEDKANNKKINSGEVYIPDVQKKEIQNGEVRFVLEANKT